MNLPLMWRRATEGLGTAGLAGLLLLVGALFAAALVSRPLVARLAVLQAELQSPSAVALQVQGGLGGPAMGAAIALDSPAQLAAFDSRFPRLQELPHLLSRIDQGALAQRVELRSAEYRLEQVPNEVLLRYRITLPVRARYAQVRGFLDHVLQQLPTAALDEISLQRDGTDPAAPLQARLRFTLFLRP